MRPVEAKELYMRRLLLQTGVAQTLIFMDRQSLMEWFLGQGDDPKQAVKGIDGVNRELVIVGRPPLRLFARTTLEFISLIQILR